jgi:hypothetical protein
MKSTNEHKKIVGKLQSQITSPHLTTMGSEKKNSGDKKVPSGILSKKQRKQRPATSLRQTRLDQCTRILQFARGSPQSQGDGQGDDLTSGLVQSLVSLNTVYPFRFAKVDTLTSNDSGVLAFSLPVDPSSSGQNYAEFSTVASLFNQVRIRSFKVTFGQIIVAELGEQLAYPGVVAGSLTTLGSPTSTTSIVENADSKLYTWASWRVKPMVHTIRYTTKPVWAETSAPDPGDNIGCPGCIMGYFEGLPLSTDTFRILVEGIYEFRTRT